MFTAQNPRLADAINFAFKAHNGQTRKGSSEAYIMHPLRVMSSLIELGITDTNILCASVLHDTLEDCDVSVDDLKVNFGERICSIVKNLTDDKTLPRNERKSKTRDKITHASSNVKLIKAADRFDNLNGEFPSFWTTEKKLQYLKESKLLIEALSKNLYDDIYSAFVRQFIDVIASKIETSSKSIREETSI